MEPYKVRDCWAGMNGIYFDTNIDGGYQFCVKYEHDPLLYADDASRDRVKMLLRLVDKAM